MMFSGPLVVRQLPAYRWAVEKTFTCTHGDLVVRVPKGYVTDLASVPRPLWWFVSPAGKHSQACVVHDYMYDNAIATKAQADAVFLAGLRDLHVPAWRAYLMYLAVKFFGRGNYV